MTEKDELEMLRAFKRQYESNELNRAFLRLEQIMDAPWTLKADTTMSMRAFRILAEALLALRREWELGR